MEGGIVDMGGTPHVVTPDARAHPGLDQVQTGTGIMNEADTGRTTRIAGDKNGPQYIVKARGMETVGVRRIGSARFEPKSALPLRTVHHAITVPLPRAPGVVSFFSPAASARILSGVYRS